MIIFLFPLFLPSFIFPNVFCLQIIQRALSDTNFINGLTGHVREVLVSAYVSGLKYTYCELSRI